MSVRMIMLYLGLASYNCVPFLNPASYLPIEHALYRKTIYRIINGKAVVSLSYADNVWYQDSIGITQISRISSVRTPTIDTVFIELVGYRLTDMRRKWVYEYHTLSDTAQVINKMAVTDTTLLVGGWNFLEKRDNEYSNILPLTDTLLSGVQYKRYRVTQSFRGSKSLSEKLVRCDKKKSVFQLSYVLREMLRCPVVKGTTLTPDTKFPTQSVELEFPLEKIPDSVRKVFAAWKRNIDKYPAVQ